LLFDIFFYRFFVAAYCIHIVLSAPEMSVATYTLSLLSSLAPDVDEGGGNCLAAETARRPITYTFCSNPAGDPVPEAEEQEHKSPYSGFISELGLFFIGTQRVADSPSLEGKFY